MVKSRFRSRSRLSSYSRSRSPSRSLRDDSSSRFRRSSRSYSRSRSKESERRSRSRTRMYEKRTKYPNNDTEETHSDVADGKKNEKEREQSDSANISSEQETLQIAAESLDQSILEILDDDNKDDELNGQEIHKSLSEKWQLIIRKGLSIETKKDLLKKYSFSKNCSLFKAPKLNPEIQAKMSEAALKRDCCQTRSQNLIGTGLSALGIVISNILEKKILADDDSANRTLATLSDSIR